MTIAYTRRVVKELDGLARPPSGVMCKHSCVPTSQDYEVTVAFKGEFGIKKLLYSYAPLEKVE